MAIQRKPKVAESQAADAFIAGAPDAKGAAPAAPAARPSSAAGDDYNKGVAKGHKRQITLTMAPHLLRRVDEMAQRTGQTRAGIINLAVSRALDGEFFK
jgi:hypothetical protein